MALYAFHPDHIVVEADSGPKTEVKHLGVVSLYKLSLVEEISIQLDSREKSSRNRHSISLLLRQSRAAYMRARTRRKITCEHTLGRKL